jgi:soluble P-type ATPase
MIEITIPGFGMAKLEHLVSDFTGTLSIDGRLIPGVKEQLNRLAEVLSLHIITADTFGTAREELKDLPLKTVVITGADQDLQKEDYVKKLGQDHVVAVGNGNNDRRMLNSARLGIAVIEGEGASAQAIMAATVVVRSITDAFALLLNPTRCTATLRF